MSRNRSILILLSLIFASMVALTGCSNVAESTETKTTAENKESNAAGKIPITTASEEARKAFLQGRDLNEKWRSRIPSLTSTRQSRLDPNFAGQAEPGTSVPPVQNFSITEEA